MLQGRVPKSVFTRHYLTPNADLEIETLQNAPRDANKLERLLKGKKRQKEEAMHIEDTLKVSYRN